MNLVRLSKAQVIYEDLNLVPGYLKAHGIVMALVFTVMFPVGALMIRLCKGKNMIWIHAGWQTLSWALMIAGLASGIRVGKILDRVSIISSRNRTRWLMISPASQ